LQSNSIPLNKGQTIALFHPVLQSIALKMVGSLADAEDIVQDTYLKWLTVDQKKIKNTKAYLTKAVVHNCLNHINSLKRRKDQYLENFNPEDLIERIKEKEFPKLDLDIDVSNALAVLHKKLAPLEKGIYILREVFNVEYYDLQNIFDKKKENCRQLFCRAKEKINLETSKIKINPNQSRFLESFKNACQSGQLSDFISELSNDIKAKFNRD